MPNVKVFIRCRPRLEHEGHLRAGKVECNELDNTIRVQATATSDRVFQFDRVLPEQSGQADVFDAVSPMVDHALGGMHATIFAYGQTGSGKTHTMEGVRYTTGVGSAAAHGPRPDLDTPTADHGIVPRVIEALYERARERVEAADPPVQYRISCSFVQLYSEKLTDLLTRRDGLKLRYGAKGNFVIDELSRAECENSEQVRELFFHAIRNKAMGSHALNQQSSRSHCIYTLYIAQWDPATPDNVTRSELTLVDLAGSEKLPMLSEDPSAQLLRESIDINTSLLALGKVITALAIRSSGATKDANQHVPYRDSKLTRLLQHALGGNAMTTMIACIAPVDAYVDETTSTLLYAGRARNIKNDPRVNEDPRGALIRQLRDEIASLKIELGHYRALALDGGIVDETALAQLVAAAHKSAGVSSDNDSGSALTDGTSVSAIAEKLLQACGMLRDVVKVNGDLRDAFDRVLVAKRKAEGREVDLEAENLALRERIEVLESIALGEDNAELRADDDDDATEVPGSSEPASPLASTTTGTVTAAAAGRRAAASAVSAAATRPSHPANGPSSSRHIGALNEREDTHQRPQPSSAPASFFNPDRDGGIAGATRIAFDAGRNRTADSPPRRTAPTNQHSNATTAAPAPRSDRPHNAVARHPVSAHFEPPTHLQQVQQRIRREREDRLKHRREQRERLVAYDSKYRRPAGVAPANYERYYGVARKHQQERTAGALGTAGIERDINALIARLPQSAAELIPTSLRAPQISAASFAPAPGVGSGGAVTLGGTTFGSLSFGGTGAAVSDLEERRRQRQQRMRELEERHRLLQQGNFAAVLAAGGSGGSTIPSTAASSNATGGDLFEGTIGGGSRGGIGGSSALAAAAGSVSSAAYVGSSLPNGGFPPPSSAHSRVGPATTGMVAPSHGSAPGREPAVHAASALRPLPSGPMMSALSTFAPLSHNPHHAGPGFAPGPGYQATNFAASYSGGRQGPAAPATSGTSGGGAYGSTTRVGGGETDFLSASYSAGARATSSSGGPTAPVVGGFSYLSADDAHRMFTPEQLELLRRRNQ